MRLPGSSSPGGQLADPKTSFQAVQDGLMQGGLGISTYVPNLVPSLNTIYSTIVFVDDPVAATGAAVETMTLDCPSCLEEFKKINALPLSGWTSSPYQLACTSPIKSLADLKGKRVRATGGNAEMVKIVWRCAGGCNSRGSRWPAATRRSGLPARRSCLAEDLWLRRRGQACHVHAARTDRARGCDVESRYRGTR